MTQSGVTAAKECQETFAKFQKKSASGASSTAYDYVTFKLSDDKKYIVVDITPEKGTAAADFNDDGGIPASYKALKAYLLQHPCLFAVYIFDWREKDGTREDVSLISWSDDAKATTSNKMQYSAAKDVLHKALNGVKSKIQANDEGDLDYKEIIKNLSKGKAIH